MLLAAAAGGADFTQGLQQKTPGDPPKVQMPDSSMHSAAGTGYRSEQALTVFARITPPRPQHRRGSGAPACGRA
jgi:hypothetical protein